MTAQIPPSRGMVAIIDDADAALVSRWKWFAHKVPGWKGDAKFYAARSERRDGKRRHIYMHRQLLGLTAGNAPRGDHRNGNTLDNRRENLRSASGALNVHNSAPRALSGFKGVFRTHRGTFVARIQTPSGASHLGTYATAADAAHAFDLAARRIYGADARLNLPDLINEPAPISTREARAAQPKRPRTRKPSPPRLKRPKRKLESWASGENHPRATMGDDAVERCRAEYAAHMAALPSGRKAVAPGWMESAAARAGLPYHTFRKIVKGRGYPSSGTKERTDERLGLKKIGRAA